MHDLDRLVGKFLPAIASAVALPLFLTPVVSCSSDSAPGSAVEVRDSAGVRIIESTGYQWQDAHEWLVPDDPLLVVGAIEGRPEEMFEEVAGALRLNDGRIVIVDGGSKELRFFDERGQFLAASGRQGGGPGEFEAPSQPWLVRDDSLVIWDYRMHRISIFDKDGRFVRSRNLQPPPDVSGFSLFWISACLAEGSLIVSLLDVSSRSVGLVRDTVTLYRLDPDWSFGEPVGRFLLQEKFVGLVDRGGQQTPFTIYLPFGREPSVGGYRDGFLFGDGKSYEIQQYAADGSLERIIRSDQPVKDVTDEDRRLLKEDWTSGVGQPRWSDELRDRTRLTLEQTPFPETMPAYQRILVDAEGNLWVKGYRRPRTTWPPGESPDVQKARWTVFDCEGVMLGVVDTPGGLSVMQIGSDFVLGVWRDESDVQFVHLYGLSKGKT